MPDGMLMLTIRPLGPERTESTFLWWFPEAKDFQDRLLQAALDQLRAPGQHRGLRDLRARAEGHALAACTGRGAYTADQEMCLHHFHRLLHRHMQPHLAAWDAERAPGMNGYLNGNGVAAEVHR